MNNEFEILRNKEILAILDGDKDFGTYEGARVAMPYLSGPALCEISTLFEYEQQYTWSGSNPSRWAILDSIIVTCIENNSMQKLFTYLFSKSKFQRQLNNVPTSKINECYDYICNVIIAEINKILFFSDKELIRLNGQFHIRNIGQELQIDTPAIKIIDRDYIRNLYERTNKDIEEGAFDSAVTKCRTLLEEVFCYAVEQTGEQPSDSGDIQKLYNQVKDAYNMHSNKDLDKRINNLLSVLNKIISSIAEMRNENSDSHGVGSRRIAIEEHHARLILNSASTLADFFLAVVERKQTQALQNITV